MAITNVSQYSSAGYSIAVLGGLDELLLLQLVGVVP